MNFHWDRSSPDFTAGIREWGNGQDGLNVPLSLRGEEMIPAWLPSEPQFLESKLTPQLLSVFRVPFIIKL